jgi:hypothetical protein
VDALKEASEALEQERDAEAEVKWNRYSCFWHILREGFKGYAVEKHFRPLFEY